MVEMAEEQARDSSDHREQNMTKLVRVEVLRRVAALGNKVNLLVFRYLWPLNATDRDDAWEGLVGCCWRAKGNLFVPCRYGTAANTRACIEHELDSRLESYKKLDTHSIAQRALANEFRWTARAVRNDLADSIRLTYRGRRRRGRPSKSRVRQTDDHAFLQNLLQIQRERFVAALGEEFWGLLVALAGHFPLSATRRGWKSAVTRLIAANRGVSQQQARSDKRTMLRMAEGEPMIEDAVHEILSGTFVSRDKSANRFIYEEQKQAQAPLA
jgi:hypothetical protein